MGSSRLKLIAFSTFLIPEALQVAHGLRAVLHQSLHVLLQALEAVVFALSVVLGARAPNRRIIGKLRLVAVDDDLGCLATFSILNFLTQCLVIHEVARAAGLDDHGPEMIEHDVVDQGKTDGDPDESEEDAKSLLEQLSHDAEESVHVQHNKHVSGEAQDSAYDLHREAVTRGQHY